MNLGLRVDRSAALLATIYTNHHRRKGSQPVTIYEFMPHQDEPAISLDEAMEKWV